MKKKDLKYSNLRRFVRRALVRLRTARFGFYPLARAATPCLLAMGATAFLSSAAHAQGPIFTGDAGNLSNIVREALKLMAILLFMLGAVGIAWSIYNKMTGKEWGSQAFGAVLAFAFGTVVAVFWQIAQGRAVSVDTNF